MIGPCNSRGCPFLKMQALINCGIKCMFPLCPVGGRVGYPEAGSHRVRRPLCRDVQWRQQAQTLHSHRTDWLPGAGAAGKSANDGGELPSPLFGFLGFMQGFINEMVYGSRWEAIWVQSSLAVNVLYIGRRLCSSIQIGINLRSLPYADRDKDLVSAHMEWCAQRVKFVVCLRLCVCLGRAHDGDGPTLSTLSVERHHERHSGWQGGGAHITQVWHLTMKSVHCTHLLQQLYKHSLVLCQQLLMKSWLVWRLLESTIKVYNVRILIYYSRTWNSGSKK